MARLEKTHGFTVKGWMRLELDLSGWDLVIYAMIHQFTVRTGSYTGGIPYIMAFTGLTRNTVRKHLRMLVTKGLIVPSGLNYIARARGSKIDPLQGSKTHPEEGQKLTQGGSKIDTEGVKICADGGQKLTPDSNRTKIEHKEKRMANAKHPSVEEVCAFVSTDDMGFADPEGFALDYVRYNTDRDWIGNNGKPIRNWKNHIRNNCRWAKDKTFPKPSAPNPTTPQFTKPITMSLR